MLAEKLIARLSTEYPNHSFTLGVAPAPVVIFSAAHPDVGDVQIFDDGSELTVMIGRFTHSHFADYMSKVPEEAEAYVVDSVISFLKRLFADEVVLWGSHRGAGGSYARGQDVKHAIAPTGPLYVWSAPLTQP